VARASGPFCVVRSQNVTTRRSAAASSCAGPLPTTNAVFCVLQ
jgi:hypothetical protein